MNNLKKEKIINCPVFTYHHFKNKENGNMAYCTSIEKFQKDLNSLVNNRYESISLRQFFNYINDDFIEKKKYFVITCDDGYKSNYLLAYPIIKKMKVFVDIFVVTSSVGLTKHPDYPNFISHFSWDEAKEMERSGFVSIQSHGKWHESNVTMSVDRLFENAMDSINKIKSHLGERSFMAYSYPNEKFDETTKTTVKNAKYNIQMISCFDISAENIVSDCVGRISVDYETNIIKLTEIYKEALASRL